MPNLSDSALRKAIDAAYMKYDKNHNNVLEKNEVYPVISEAMGTLGYSAPPKMVVDRCLSAIDSNNDGVIQKMELFNILKKVLPVWWSLIVFRILIFHTLLIAVV